MPKSPMELTTRCKSSKAASFFDAHDERLEDADAVGDADTLIGTSEDGMGNEVVVV